MNLVICYFKEADRKSICHINDNVSQNNAVTVCDLKFKGHT